MPSGYWIEVREKMSMNVYNLPMTGRVVGNQLKYGNTRASGIWMTILWRITAIDVANRQVTMDFTPQVMYDASVSVNYPTDLSYGVNAYDWKMTVEQTAPIARTVNSSFVTWAKTANPITDYSSVLGDPNYPGKSFLGFGNSSMSSYQLSNLNGPFRTNEYTYSNTFNYATDGTFKLKISASGNTLESNSSRNLTYYQLWETSATTTTTIDLTLPTIISMNNGYLDDTLDINFVNETVNNELTLLKHKITYSIGDLNGTITTGYQQPLFQWKVPKDTFSPLYDDGSIYKEIKITCITTKANGDSVGEYSINRYLFAKREDMSYTVLRITDTDANVPTKATNDNTQLVRFMSDPHLEIEVIAHKEISRATIENDGVSTLILTSQEAADENKYPGGLPNVYKTSLQLADVEDGVFKGIVNCADETTSVTTLEKELIPYYKLTSNISGIKISANGQVSFTLSGNCFNDRFGEHGNFNTLKLYYRYALTEHELEEEEWEPCGAITRTPEHTYTIDQVVGGLNIQNKYYFQIKTYDLLMEIVSDSFIVLGKPVFDWNNDDFNLNVPFRLSGETVLKRNVDANNVVLSSSEGNVYIRPNGTYSTAGQVEVKPDGSVTFNGNISVNGSVNYTGDISLDLDSILGDYVIETGEEAMGTNGTWYWRKWASGKSEAWGCRNFGNTAVTTAWGNLYRSAVFTQDLPSKVFVRTPDSININIVHGNFGGWICKHEQTAPSATTTGSFIWVRPASATVTPTNLGFYIIGEWK